MITAAVAFNSTEVQIIYVPEIGCSHFETSNNNNYIKSKFLQLVRIKLALLQCTTGATHEEHDFKLYPFSLYTYYLVVSRSQTLTRKSKKAGESLVTLAIELVLIGPGISGGDNCHKQVTV